MGNGFFVDIYVLSAADGHRIPLHSGSRSFRRMSWLENHVLLAAPCASNSPIPVNSFGPCSRRHTFNRSLGSRRWLEYEDVGQEQHSCAPPPGRFAQAALGLQATHPLIIDFARAYIPFWSPAIFRVAHVSGFVRNERRARACRIRRFCNFGESGLTGTLNRAICTTEHRYCSTRRATSLISHSVVLCSQKRRPQPSQHQHQIFSSLFHV